MNMVAGHADQALDEDVYMRLAVAIQLIEPGWKTGLMKTTMSPRLRLAVVHQRHPLRGRSKVMWSTTR